MSNQELGIVLLSTGSAQWKEPEAVNPLRKKMQTANKCVFIMRK